MIVSSVYSWLKELRSNFDIYDDYKLLKSTSGDSKPKSQPNSRKCSCTCSTMSEDMFEISEIGEVLLRNDLRRSVPLKKSHRRLEKSDKTGFADLCIQERAKKTWSVGDAWGLDFQLNNLRTAEESDESLQSNLEQNLTERKTSECAIESDETVKEALDQFSFLSDIETDSDIYEDVKSLKEPQPVYVNITTIGNPRLRQELTHRDSTLSNMSLSSAYSYVSCGPSEGTLDSTSMTSIGSSGTYTLNSGRFKSSESMVSMASTYSGATFQTEDNMSIRDDDYWTSEEWRSIGSLNEVPTNPVNPEKPLKKGKSLDSFNLPVKLSLSRDQTNEVQLRRKDNTNRRSVIPILSSEIRKAIILPKCKTPDQQSTYMNIWECYSKTETPSEKVKPIPAPRTKFAKPPPPPKPRQPVVRMSSIEIKKARENIVSFAFDETVEYLQVEKPVPKKDVDNECERLPPLDVILWMTHLQGECEWEPDEVPGTSFESNEFSRSPLKSSKSREQDIMLGHHSPGVSFDNTDKFDFNNVKKYKMDNQVVKLSKNDIFEKQDGKLLHKNSDGTKTLAEKISDCQIEQISPKEYVIIRPDNKKIILYNKNSKDKPTPDSPESMRSPSTKADRMNRLMQFFIRRPERDTLRDRGILRNENVFGNTLVQLDIKHNSTVPNLVRKCIEYVELPANIVTQGLYRSSASLAILQEIRFAINDTDGKDLSSLEKYKMSPDVPSGLLKLFIRELKEPLIGIVEFEKMHEVCKNTDTPENKYKSLFRIINMMIDPHRDTLDVLLTHLIKVISYRDQNDMTIEGISICWGQSMITENPPTCDPVMIARKRNEVVEILLKAYDTKINGTLSSQDTKYPEQKLEDQKAHQENTLNQTKEVTKDLVKDDDIEKSEKDTPKVNPIKKPKRLPHRQGSVEAHMKPSLTKVSPKTSKTSLTSIESGSRLSNQSGSAISGFGTSGNYVQSTAAKLQSIPGFRFGNHGSSNSFSTSLESLNRAGSIMSLCNSEPSRRLKFMRDLIRRIESIHDFKGIYKGKGKHNLVMKIVKKYKKENSKEFHRLMGKADIFVMGAVLQEVVKECGYIMDFYDMQTLVEEKEKLEMYQIFAEIPEEFYLVFRHLDNLLMCSKTDELTLLEDMFTSWWSILISNPQNIIGPCKERIGKNSETFRKLIQVIQTPRVDTQYDKMKSASLSDLRLLDNDVNFRDNKVLCCQTSGNRCTTFYFKE